jgi:hypothetical protein
VGPSAGLNDVERRKIWPLSGLIISSELWKIKKVDERILRSEVVTAGHIISHPKETKLRENYTFKNIKI